MPLIERIISLTGVGSRGGRTGAAWKNGEKRLLPLFLVLPFAGCASGYSPETMFDDYNYVVGTQTFGSKYQFTDEPRLVETAREIHGLGSNIIKFRLEPTFAEDNYSGPNPGKYNSLKELASRDEAIRTALGMPFSYYFLWVTPMQPCRWQDEDGYTGEDAEVEYREIYELTRHLLQTYAGTGKTFYLGNWEGDWMLLQGFDRTKDPDPRDVREMIKWVNNRQRAIDAAKRDTPHSNVAVYHYLELVLVERGIRGRPCIATEVLPHTSVDYVSYSAYEMQNDRDLPAAMDRVLGFIKEQLPAKPGVPGPRVFIGEFGRQGNTVGPLAQRDHAIEFIQAALEWGSPFILWWQLYGNEVEDGTYRGYWLIDDKGQAWPIYGAFRDYYKAARAYLAEAYAEAGGLPEAAVFREKARTFFNTPDRFANLKWETVSIEGFENGLPEGWKTGGDEVSVSEDDPREGAKHLRLAADGQPAHWSAASMIRKAAPGQAWQAEVSAKCKSGPLLRLKLEFHDALGNKLRILSRTSVESSYVPVKVRALAPEGTTEVHVVLAVEYGSGADPVVAYFDDLVLRQSVD
jgi:hypothetical protein